SGSCTFPQPRHRMLKHRKLIDLVTDIVQQAFDQRGLDRSARLFHWFADNVGELIARERRNEELVRAHDFGEPLEAGAFPDEVGPHGEEDVHVARLTAACLKEELNEFGRVVAYARVATKIASWMSGACVAKQLLELIDDQEQGPVAKCLDLGKRVGDA